MVAKADKIPGTLGILVCSDKYMSHVVNLTRAAYARSKQVHIFFTGSAVFLTLLPEFRDLVGRAALSICDVSFRAFGYTDVRMRCRGSDSKILPPRPRMRN